VAAVSLSVHPAVCTLADLIAGARRHHDGAAGVAPEIPTAAEAGLPGMIAQNSFGLFVPADTPRSIVGRIAQATGTATTDGEFRGSLIAAGFDRHPDSSPEAARASSPTSSHAASR